MGEFHFSRCPRAYWDDAIHKIRGGGVTIIATYVFWNHHEQREGEFDWSGDRDLREFVERCGRRDISVALRIGPFCHGEVRNGGLPDWLYAKPFEARSNDPRYLALVQRLYQQIGQQVRGLLFKDGGPIVIVQCENEFMDSAAPWETTQNPAMQYTPRGAGGVEHMLTLKRLAIEAGLDVPLFTSTGWGKSPVAADDFLPVFGGYAFHAWLDDPSKQEATHNYLFLDAHARHHPSFDTATVPYACCELGGGMQPYYRNRPVVPAASVEAMHVVYLGRGGNLMGYYMYHGGTNPVLDNQFMNEHRTPRMSYDYQAPVREFGQLSEAYHHLRRQFLFLQQWGPTLAPMRTILPSDGEPISPTDTQRLRAAIRSDGTSGFIFLNNYQDHVAMQDQTDVRLHVHVERVPITVPAGAGVTLPKDACAIWPLNLLLDGVRLCYATAQPLTRIERGQSVTHCFFAVDGVRPEFCFNAASIRELSVTGGTVTAGDHCSIVTVEPGMHSLIRVMPHRGDEVLILTLSDRQSLAAWKVRLGGAEHLVVSDADLVPSDDGFDVITDAGAQATLWLYPHDPGAPGLQVGQFTVTGEAEGAFHRFTLPSSSAHVDCTVEIVASDRALVRVGAGVMRDLDELILRVEYEGDMGEAYIGGRLVHDHFHNHTPWDLGLKHLLRHDMETELLIRILPRHGDAAPRVEYTTMAAMQVTGTSHCIAEIKTISVVPRCRTTVHRSV